MQRIAPVSRADQQGNPEMVGTPLEAQGQKPPLQAEVGSGGRATPKWARSSYERLVNSFRLSE
jgi:hypothetical protein